MLVSSSAFSSFQHATGALQAWVEVEVVLVAAGVLTATGGGVGLMVAAGIMGGLGSTGAMGVMVVVDLFMATLKGLNRGAWQPLGEGPGLAVCFCKTLKHLNQDQ